MEPRSLSRVALELGKSVTLIERWSSWYGWRARLLEWTIDPAAFEAKLERSQALKLSPAVRARPVESPEAWRAWQCYLSLGDSRSYRRVAAELGKSQSLIARWGKTHRWQKRLAAHARQEEPLLSEPSDDAWMEEAARMIAAWTEHGPHRKSHASARKIRRAVGGVGASRPRGVLRPVVELPALAPYLQPTPAHRPPPPGPLAALAERIAAGEISPLAGAAEAIASIAPVVKSCCTDAPLWHDEVREHLDDLQQLLRAHCGSCSTEQQALAVRLVTVFAHITRDLKHKNLRSASALEHMLDRLRAFFVDPHNNELRAESKPHLDQLNDLLEHLPGSQAALYAGTVRFTGSLMPL